METKQMMGEVLVELGLIDEHRLRHALEVSKKNGNMKLGETLIRLGYLSEERVLEILRNLTGVLTLNMTTWTIKKHAQVMLPPERMKEMKVIPLDSNNKKAVVAFADPLNYVAVENIKFLINRDVTPVLASMAQIDDILAHFDHVGYGVKNLPLIEVRRSVLDITVQDLTASTVLRLLDEPGSTALHLSMGTSPVVRAGGHFKRSSLPLITASVMEKIVKEVIPDDEMELLKEKKEVEYTYAKPGMGRYRMNIYYQKGGEITVAAKKLEENIPSADLLGIPEMLISLLDKRGLLLVSSIRGMGKDTTIASLVDHINSTQNCNIITFENPIEYVHHHKMSNVNQREIGRDTDKNLDDVFDHVIKLDPDVLVISNLKDMYAMDTAVLAANKGILVIAGVNAMDVFSAIERIQSSLSDDYLRALFSRSLLASFSQRLIWSKPAKKRILVWETLLATRRIQKYIRDDKVYFVKGQAPSLRNEYFPIEESIALAIKQGRLDLDSVKNEPWINQDALKALVER
jgi:twitching motility protein PilT